MDSNDSKGAELLYSFLVIDDEPMICKSICLMLERSGLPVGEIKGAGDGKEALAYMNAKAFDFVITDIRMPKMDGLELLREIVKSWPETYILVVSGYDEFKYAQKALKYGAKDYLLKPLDQKELIKTITEIIKKHKTTDLPFHIDHNEMEEIVSLFEVALWAESRLSIEQECEKVLKFDNKIIYSSKEAATIKKNQTTFQGFVEFDVPKVASREKFVIYMAIIKYGEVLHYTKEEYTAFPEIEESNIEFLDYDCYDKSRAEINQEIRNGRKVIFAPLREGEYIIAEKKITVKNCGMQTLYFVSRDTGHKMVEEFEKGDFSYWYDEKEDRLAPIIYATFEGENIKPILTSGNNNKGWRKTFACGEFEFGEGQVVICQLDLNNKYKNPVARKFSTKLIE